MWESSCDWLVVLKLPASLISGKTSRVPRRKWNYLSAPTTRTQPSGLHFFARFSTAILFAVFCCADYQIFSHGSFVRLDASLSTCVYKRAFAFLVVILVTAFCYELHTGVHTSFESQRLVLFSHGKLASMRLCLHFISNQRRRNEFQGCLRHWWCNKWDNYESFDNMFSFFSFF